MNHKFNPPDYGRAMYNRYNGGLSWIIVHQPSLLGTIQGPFTELTDRTCSKCKGSKCKGKFFLGKVDNCICLVMTNIIWMIIKKFRKTLVMKNEIYKTNKQTSWEHTHPTQDKQEYYYSKLGNWQYGKKNNHAVLYFAFELVIIISE